jgi:hypothetical protein
MLNFDPRKPLYRALFVLVGLVFIGLGTTALLRDSMTYDSWWGGLVFAPFAILFGTIFIVGAIFKPSIFRNR